MYVLSDVDIKKVLKNIGKVLEWFVFLFLLFILFLVLSPLLPTREYISTHVVPTGSMEPTIMTGSVVFSSLEIGDDIKEEDIIVFESPNDPEVSIVHRIVEKEDGEYITKGDNNENGIQFTSGTISKTSNDSSTSTSYKNFAVYFCRIR